MADSKKDPGAQFNQLLQADRKKKKFQDAADSIFGKRSGPGVSLASRVGITKGSASTTPKPSIGGQWTHDLHHRNNPRASRPSLLARSQSAHKVERSTKLANSLRDAIANNDGNNQINLVGFARGNGGGQMSIKGKAGLGPPYVVIASNFAPGTTAADIEAAVHPIGGDMDDCYLISETPTVMCEILFKDKAGAENVISTFNNQKADGRLLYVYMKAGGPSPRINKPLNTALAASVGAGPLQPASAPPRGPRGADERDLMEVDADRPPRNDRYDSRPRGNDSYQDGRYGFGSSYNGSYGGRGGRDYRGRGDGRGMYSDRMYSSSGYRRA